MGVIVWLTSLKMIKCLFFVLVEVNSPSTVYSSDNPWRLGSLVHEKWNFTDPFLKSYHLRFGCKCLEYEIEFDTNLIVSFYLFCRKYFPIYNYDNKKIHYANKLVENWQLLATW